MGQMYYKTSNGSLIAIGTPVGPIQEGTNPDTGNNGYFFYDTDATDTTAMTLLSSTTDNGVPRFDGTGGLLQTSAVTISDTGELAGAVIPASQIKGEAWTSWTPTISQNGAKTITNSSSTYMQAGKLVIARARVVITQAGTTANVISSSLPVTPLYAGDTSIGSFTYLTTGGTRYAGSVIIWTSSLLLFQVTGQANVLGIAPSFATANGDIFTFTMTYEAA